MKRNFKVIKQDKNLSNLSDVDIDKLYNTYIEMDGKHQDFKGSKREYCSTVAGMIKDWMKAVVDKNGGISNKTLTGGKGTRLASRALYKSKNDELKIIQQEIEKLKEKKVVSATSETIKNLTKQQEEKMKKIKEIKREINIASLNSYGRTLLENVKKTIVENEENIKKIYNPNTKAALAFKDLKRSHRRLTLEEAQKDYDEELEAMVKEREKVIADPEYRETDPSELLTKLITKNNKKIDGLKKEYLEDIKKINELKPQEKEEVKRIEEEEELRVKKIEELETKKEEIEKEKERIKEEEKKHEVKKARNFGKTIKNIAFANRPALAETETFVKKATGEKYTLQELVNEADDYKRVIKFFLGGKLYSDYDVGIQGSEEVKTVKRFLKALPYKKLLEITPKGYAERVKFVDALIAENDYFKMGDTYVRWSEEIEESFRSESFVFWTLLAKDIKKKDEVVNNFELLGKIFSHVLFFSPVDFKTKYVTGDSKGVKSTSQQTNGFKYPRDPVVDLGKILSVLSEAATIKPSGEMEFNNPRIIFTFYRDNREIDRDGKPIGPSKMLVYTQNKTAFSKKLPYELLLDYDLKTLLSGEGGEAIKKIIREARTPGGNYLQHKDNLEILKNLVNEKYGVRNPTTLFPIPGKPNTFTLRMSSDEPMGEKIRKDLKIVGYTEEIFQDDEPTIKNYTKRYKESSMLEYNGSYIRKFKFPGLFGEGTVVTEIEVQGETDDDDVDVYSAPGEIEGYFRDGESDVQRIIRLEDEAKKKEAEESAAKIAAIKESSRLSREKKEAEEAAAVAKKEELRKLREEREAKQAAEPKKPVIRKKIIKKSETKSAPDEETETLTKLTKEQQAALKKREEEEEGSDEGSGKPLIARGKPKAYIKKIIKYYS